MVFVSESTSEFSTYEASSNTDLSSQTPPFEECFFDWDVNDDIDEGDLGFHNEMSRTPEGENPCGVKKMEASSTTLRSHIAPMGDVVLYECATKPMPHTYCRDDASSDW
jgi:hypothetical protein